MLGTITLTLLLLLLTSLGIYLAYFRVRSHYKMLNSIDSCLRQIEINPVYPDSYDRLITICKSLYGKQHNRFLKFGCYRKILQVCTQNIDNLKAWELLETMISKFSNLWYKSSLAKDLRVETLQVLVETLVRNFDDRPIRERVLSAICLLDDNKREETEQIYNAILDLIEVNSMDDRAKQSIGNLLNLHYSILWNRIYDATTVIII